MFGEHQESLRKQDEGWSRRDSPKRTIGQGRKDVRGLYADICFGTVGLYDERRGIIYAFYEPWEY